MLATRRPSENCTPKRSSSSGNGLPSSGSGLPHVGKPRHLIVWVGDQASAQAKQEHKPDRIRPNVAQRHHGVVRSGQQQRHRGHARKHLRPLPPPHRMDHLEAGDPRRLVEEAHHRMLTRRPIVHGAALAAICPHNATQPPQPCQHTVAAGEQGWPLAGPTVRLRPGRIALLGHLRVERRANDEAPSVMDGIRAGWSGRVVLWPGGRGHEVLGRTSCGVSTADASPLAVGIAAAAFGRLRRIERAERTDCCRRPTASD